MRPGYRNQIRPSRRLQLAGLWAQPWLFLPSYVHKTRNESSSYAPLYAPVQGVRMA